MPIKIAQVVLFEPISSVNVLCGVSVRMKVPESAQDGAALVARQPVARRVVAGHRAPSFIPWRALRQNPAKVAVLRPELDAPG